MTTLRAVSIVLVTTCLPALAGDNSSDHPTLPTEPVHTYAAMGHATRPLERLADLFHDNKSPKPSPYPIVAAAREILDRLEMLEKEPSESKAPETPCFTKEQRQKDGTTQERLAFDSKQNFYRILFRRPGTEKVLSFFVHDGMHPHATKLNWSKTARLCQVLLTYRPDAEIASAYASTHQANPLLAQAPAFLASLKPAEAIGKLIERYEAGRNARLGTPPLAQPRVEEPLFWALISEIPLPYDRASVDVTDEITEPAYPILSEIRQSACELRDKIEVRETLFCPETLKLANLFEHAVSAFRWNDASQQIVACVKSRTPKGEPLEECPLTALETLGSCVGGDCPKPGSCAELLLFSRGGQPVPQAPCPRGGGPGCCDPAQPGACWKAMAKAVADAYAKPGPVTPDCVRALLEIEERFQETTTRPKADALTATSKYAMAPPARMSFGVMASALFNVSRDSQRVKVDDAGALVRDPLSGTVELAIVNLQPWGYDPDREVMSPAEQFRFFVGAAISGSHFGPAVGIGVAPFPKVRGFAVNVGGALLRIDTLPDGKNFGDAIEDTKLRHSWARTMIFGFSYNFEP